MGYRPTGSSPTVPVAARPRPISAGPGSTRATGTGPMDLPRPRAGAPGFQVKRLVARLSPGNVVVLSAAPQTMSNTRDVSVHSPAQLAPPHFAGTPAVGRGLTHRSFA